jgi:3-deoxy-manno-octulosonate cytidylyltransferase (CMP-KDO synthetase)
MQIKQLCNCFNDPKTQIATLVKKISETNELFNENKVKAVLNNKQFALYFSRNPIPYFRAEPKENWINKQTYFKHIGIYGYQTPILKEITQLSPSSLELTEGLEQLRWLENGFNIKVAETELEAISIDTPEDLQKISS